MRRFSAIAVLCTILFTNARAADKPEADREASWGSGDARDHWAFQPIQDPAPPDVADVDWKRRELDAFVLHRLAAQGLMPSPDASPETLLRRLHFDLIGLPPAPDAIDGFLRAVQTEGLDAAVSSEVDRLLSMPQFGERWGRHWLDVARFGESSGKEANISFPYAWRYRDYVFDCFAADLPFDRFLTEQVAGDLLPYADDAERARLLIATGFLAIGPKNLDEANAAQFEADVVDEQIDSVSRAVLGLSVACARCHDHKFDPVTMDDYYALAGVFRSTKTFFGTAVAPANRVGGDPLPLPTVEGQHIFHGSIPAERVSALKEELAALQEEQRVGQAAVMKAVIAGEDPSGIFTLRDALRIFWRSGAIEGQLEKVDDDGHALPLAMGVLDRDQIVDTPFLEGGEIAHPGDPVPRGFPQVIPGFSQPTIPSKESGRLELAAWLTSPDNPLTARVYVNRVWHHLLGAGIVADTDNFGTTGSTPSHPDLIDHLASRFIASGWSTKQIVREIVLSRTYRQASTFRASAFEVDPDNRLLWRASKRRLEAEAMRDAMLSVSGELDLSRPPGSLVGRVIGDRPISLIGLDKRLPADLDGAVHRSVYLPVIRDRLPDVLDLFDFAEPSLVTGDREQTNVPVQAHYLMNSPFVQARADELAARLSLEADSPAERISLAFRLCFARLPDQAELQRSLSFLAASETGSDALMSFCQALLATAEFRNLD